MKKIWFTGFMVWIAVLSHMFESAEMGLGCWSILSRAIITVQWLRCEDVIAADSTAAECVPIFWDGFKIVDAGRAICKRAGENFATGLFI